MTPELQTVVDRLELVERQNRVLRLTAWLAMAIALGAVAVPFLARSKASPEHARYSVVEANRFLLRDRGGDLAGGLETDNDGNVRLVLGNGRHGAAFLEVQPAGVAHLTLRGPDGEVRAALIGARMPSLALSPEGMGATAVLTTLPEGGGSLALNDARGRVRFHAP